jgi:hydrogenase maturation factor
MCIGSIEVLVETWTDGGARVGRLESGRTVSLGFVPDAHAGATVLLHLGIPVEVLDPRAADEAVDAIRDVVQTRPGGDPP